MRKAGRPSWQVTVDVPQVLAIALYIRDVAGIAQTSPPIDLPETTPSVAVDRTLLPLPEVAGQWNRWWMHALTTGPHALKDMEPPGFPAFVDAPALQDLLRVYFNDARRWSDDRRSSRVGTNRRGLPLGELVTETERAMGRVAAPFRLRIDVVPVAGLGMWSVRPAHMLVSSALLDDPPLLVARLRPEVELLA